MLAHHVIQEYIERVSNEELLKRPVAAARRAPFRIDETEVVVIDYRRKNQA